MDIIAYKAQVDENVIALMEEFMSYGSDFTEGDIKSAKQLMYDYLDALEALEDPTDETIMEEVKTLVLALNELNEETDYSIIETDEREAIWEIIQNSAIDCGLKDYSDDITEEWRDW